MDNTGAFEKIKNKVDIDDNIEIEFIIKTLSVYTKKDLHLFRDCIDIMLVLYDK